MFDFLNNQTQLQLPNPMQGMAQTMTLAQLASKMQNEQLQNTGLQNSLDDRAAVDRVLPILHAGKWSNEAIQTALQAEPKARNAIITMVDAKRKADIETADKESQIKDRNDKSNREALKTVGNMANDLYTKDGDISPFEMSAFAKKAKFAGVPDEVLSTMPGITEQGQSNNLRAWFRNFGAVSSDPKAQEEILDIQRKRPGLMAETDAKTENYKATTDNTRDLMKWRPEEMRIKGENATSGSRNATTAEGRLGVERITADPFGLLGINGGGAGVGGGSGGGRGGPTTSTTMNPPATTEQQAWIDANGGAGAQPRGASGGSGILNNQNLRGDEFLKSLPPALSDQVKALAEGRMPFPGSFALKTPYWQGMLSAVAQYDPTFDAVNYNARSQTRTDFTKGKMAGNLTSAATVLQHLDALDKSYKSLENFGGVMTPLNTPVNAVENFFGDARQSDIELKVNAVADEMARVFRQTGMSESEVLRWKTTLNKNKSPEGQQAVIEAAMELLKGRMDAIGDQYNRGMGTTTDPIQLLSPRAQEVYNRLAPKKDGKKESKGDGADKGELMVDKHGNRARVFKDGRVVEEK